MITPEEFPYIKSLHIDDCYAYQNFDIHLAAHKPFSHLILTGKNGSGKSTILKGIDFTIYRTARSPYYEYIKDLGIKTYFASQIDENEKIPSFTLVEANNRDKSHKFLEQKNGFFIRYFFETNRLTKVEKVTSVVPDSKFSDILEHDPYVEPFLSSKFKQYLVNKKIYQAFDEIDKNNESITTTNTFFESITNIFRSIFEDEGLQLVFVRENFEYFIQLSNGQKLTFNVLNDGFSALLSILMDLLVRLDLIRTKVSNFSYNPCGIVLIDEPETHLHLQLQYQVLPLLTTLFPNVQFIVATHSPAVISSIKNATVFDLTTKETETDRVVGRSFSELMVSHFKLDNEYSNIADDIFAQINQTIRNTSLSATERQQKLQAIFAENEGYLSPATRLELESMILENA